MTAADLPPINAGLNAASAVLLLSAYTCIKHRKIRSHAYLMCAAVLTACAFLTCYVIYHYKMGEKSSGIPAGLFRTSYLTMLFTHVLLAVVMLPMIVTVLLRAYRRDWLRHKRLARPTFWIWLYVSVTGVIIYFVLYHLVPAMYAAGGARNE